MLGLMESMESPEKAFLAPIGNPKAPSKYFGHFCPQAGTVHIFGDLDDMGNNFYHFLCTCMTGITLLFRCCVLDSQLGSWGYWAEGLCGTAHGLLREVRTISCKPRPSF